MVSMGSVGGAGLCRYIISDKDVCDTSINLSRDYP